MALEVSANMYLPWGLTEEMSGYKTFRLEHSAFHNIVCCQGQDPCFIAMYICLPNIKHLLSSSYSVQSI